MKSRYQCGVWLIKNIGWDTASYLPEDVKRLIFDWKILDEVVNNTTVTTPRFFDYSFVLAPLYKAVEGTLWKIAHDLHLVKQKGVLGNYFTGDYIDQLIPVFEKKGLTKKDITQIRNELIELKTFLKRYRHDPAHYGYRLKTYEESHLAALSALHNIKCILTDLRSVNLLPQVNENGVETFIKNEDFLF